MPSTTALLGTGSCGRRQPDDAVVTRSVGSGRPVGRTARQDVEYEAEQIPGLPRHERPDYGRD